MMRRLGLLLALAVIVTTIMIVSAMPAMAGGKKPTYSGGGGGDYESGGKGAGYGTVVHQGKGGDDVYHKKGTVCNSCRDSD